MNSQVWIIGFITAVLLFQIVSIPALMLRKNDLADVLWGPAFPLTIVSSIIFVYPQGFESLSLRSLIIFLLVTIWAIRLFIHVGLRNLSHVTEDVRYNNWRKQWGDTWIWRSYLQVFVLQALIMYVFVTPALLSLASPAVSLGVTGFLGIAVWFFGFVFESVADEQLRRFKLKPENKGVLMTQGLWSWSRHPNYFGEVVQWWGIWLMVVEIPWGWATIVSPIGVSFLILRVSGVSMLEELMKNRPGYEEYKAQTSEFFPFPPKHKG